MHAADDAEADCGQWYVANCSCLGAFERQRICFKFLGDTLILTLRATVQSVGKYSQKFVHAMPLMVAGRMRWEDHRKVDPVVDCE